MPQYSEGLYRSIVLVDVAGFTHESRTVLHQTAVHGSLTELLQRAFDDAGVEWSSCDVEDRGDGKMILVPPEVPRVRLADQLWSRLLAELRRHNMVHSDEAAMKLRVALHAGDVRLSSNGKVSNALNFAHRLLDAPEAKESLKQSKSLLGLIVSEDFFHDVIRQDQAAEPDAFRKIPVVVKETVADAWLRLSEVPRPSQTSGSALVPPGDHEPDHVLDLLPMSELGQLEDSLVVLDVPQLPTLLRRAAGPGASVPAGTNAWEVLMYLTDFNAGADGLPPALAFVDLLAGQVDDGALRERLRNWNDVQARRLQLTVALARFRVANSEPVMADGRLHLMIVADHDGIDTDHFVVCYWRQDDPEEWPPARGDTRKVRRDEIEQHVDTLINDAERAWRGHNGTVALEIVLPRALLDLPVHQWHRGHGMETSRPLCIEYSVVVRSLDRMRAEVIHRPWYRRWRKLQHDPWTANVHFARPGRHGSPYALDASLEGDDRCVAVVLTSAPTPESDGENQLRAALRSGLPAVLWHRHDVDPEAMREVVQWLAEGGGLGDLPARSQALRRESHLDPPVRFNVKVVRDLVVMWDDPDRLVNPEELAV